MKTEKLETHHPYVIHINNGGCTTGKPNYKPQTKQNGAPNSTKDSTAKGIKG